MSKKLDDAIEAVLAKSRPTGCWGSRLDGDADEFVTRLMDLEGQGVKVNRTEARSILAKTFDVKIGEDAFRSHLTGTCSCE